MSTPGTEHVRWTRVALQSAGLRQVLTWVPDTRRPDFAAECRRQAAVVAEADRRDHETGRLTDAALAELDSLE